MKQPGIEDPSRCLFGTLDVRTGVCLAAILTLLGLPIWPYFAQGTCSSFPHCSTSLLVANVMMYFVGFITSMLVFLGVKFEHHQSLYIFHVISIMTTASAMFDAISCSVLAILYHTMMPEEPEAKQTVLRFEVSLVTCILSGWSAYVARRAEFVLYSRQFPDVASEFPTYSGCQALYMPFWLYKYDKNPFKHFWQLFTGRAEAQNGGEGKNAGETEKKPVVPCSV